MYSLQLHLIFKTKPGPRFFTSAGNAKKMNGKRKYM